jgi:predicted dehydrogenase
MKPGSVLFVGLGGAGQRHLRVLRQRLPDARFLAFRQTRSTPLLAPDFSVKPGNVEEAYGLTTVTSLSDAFAGRPDLVVIATPSSLHYEPMMAAARHGASLLVEKPWSSTLAGFETFRTAVQASRGRFRISFQRRFHPLLRRVKKLVESGQLGSIASVRMAVGSYVPDWHPYEDWKQLYAVRRELGGGVLLTEIHEIDLAFWFFGVPRRVLCLCGNFGAERLDVEDTAQLTLEYPNFVVQISLCFMQREPRRGIEIAGAGGYVTCDLVANRLQHVDYRSGQRTTDSPASVSNEALFEWQADALLVDDSNDTEEQLRAAWCSQAIVAAARLSAKDGRAVTMPAYPQETVQ